MPTEIVVPNMSVGQEQSRYLSKYVLTVDCSTGKLTLVPISSSPTTPLPSNEALNPPVNQDRIIGPPEPTSSNSNEVTRLIQEVQSLPLATPLTSNEVPFRSVTPEEVLPHPQVPQTGPRVPRNKNRGASRVLTNSPEMAKLKESYDTKVLKENKRLLKESNITNITKKVKCLRYGRILPQQLIGYISMLSLRINNVSTFFVIWCAGFR